MTKQEIAKLHRRHMRLIKAERKAADQWRNVIAQVRDIVRACRWITNRPLLGIDLGRITFDEESGVFRVYLKNNEGEELDDKPIRVPCEWLGLELHEVFDRVRALHAEAERRRAALREERLRLEREAAQLKRETAERELEQVRAELEAHLERRLTDEDIKTLARLVSQVEVKREDA